MRQKVTQEADWGPCLNVNAFWIGTTPNTRTAVVKRHFCYVCEASVHFYEPLEWLPSISSGQYVRITDYSFLDCTHLRSLNKNWAKGHKPSKQICVMIIPHGTRISLSHAYAYMSSAAILKHEEVNVLRGKWSSLWPLASERMLIYSSQWTQPNQRPQRAQ